MDKGNRKIVQKLLKLLAENAFDNYLGILKVPILILTEKETCLLNYFVRGEREGDVFCLNFKEAPAWYAEVNRKDLRFVGEYDYYLSFDTINKKVQIILVKTRQVVFELTFKEYSIQALYTALRFLL